MDILKYKNGPKVIIPKLFNDERGYFFESYNANEFEENVDTIDFVQDNESCSSTGVLRGFHYQKPPYDQAKLVRVVKGSAIDVIVDIRKDSPYYGEWSAEFLSEENQHQFYVPRGFAHAFLALEDNTIFQYKCDNFYNKESEGGIIWNDPTINFKWEEWIDLKDIKLSEKDEKHPCLNDFDTPFTDKWYLRNISKD